MSLRNRKKMIIKFSFNVEEQRSAIKIQKKIIKAQMENPDTQV
jgi:hypothetical protein